MFEFVGKLIGIALRTKMYLPFELCPLAWMLISNEPVDVNPLLEVDTAAARAIESVRRCETRKIADEEAFAAAFNSDENTLRFTFESVTGRCDVWRRRARRGGGGGVKDP